MTTASAITACRSCPLVPANINEVSLQKGKNKEHEGKITFKVRSAQDFALRSIYVLFNVKMEEVRVCEKRQSDFIVFIIFRSSRMCAFHSILGSIHLSRSRSRLYECFYSQHGRFQVLFVELFVEIALNVRG